MKNLIKQIGCAATLLVAAMMAGPASAQATACADFSPMGSNYYAYPYPQQPLPELTPSPAGYKPFHIEHYGRHGSRWHIGRGVYTEPVRILEIGERNGKLTPLGREVLSQIRVIEKASRGRDGELTAKGARQHQGIARRMMANFPEVFVDSLYINARSTPVVRCILSMDNELRTMAQANNTFLIDEDATYADLDVLNPTDTLTSRYGDRAYSYFKQFEAKHPYSYDFLGKLFVDDAAFVADSIPRDALLWSLFNIAANTQSHDNQPSLWHVFTPDEIAQKWRHANLDWFLRSGNTALSQNMTPFSQRRLLRSFIESADTAIASPRQSATLRFGHEVVVLPVTVLMELDDYGREINDVEAVDSLWRNYEIFPMASNIQLVFYESAGGSRESADKPVLVKVLLNEREVRLPAGHVEGPYYDWNVLKDYYLNKLNTWEAANCPR